MFLKKSSCNVKLIVKLDCFKNLRSWLDYNGFSLLAAEDRVETWKENFAA